MKTVILVNITPVYISNDTCQPVELDDKQKLISCIFTNEYTFVQVYTKLAQFTGKTYKELDKQIDKYSSENNNHNFETIIIKK